jgi:glyoxylase-like metal-dependent hydrolase (beta-lactamase superfamily II)
MKWKIGDITITKLQEIYYPEFPDLLIGVTPEMAKQVPWLSPHFVSANGHLSLSVHTLIVETPNAKLVVDTCIGDGRNRDPYEVMSRLTTTYLQDMRALGYQPEDIDYVLCTHLHFDHVGWNTRLENDKWVPTFPNAAYLMAKRDLELFGAIGAEEPDDFLQIQRRVYEECLLPILDAGLAKPVDGATSVCDGVSLVPSPGHSPGHCSVLIESQGERALITGDFLHHPIQCWDPKLSSAADYDHAQAIATRQRMFAEYANQPTLIIGTHFAAPTAGHFVIDGDAYRFDV